MDFVFVASGERGVSRRAGQRERRMLEGRNCGIEPR